MVDIAITTGEKYKNYRHMRNIYQETLGQFTVINGKRVTGKD
jgi:hypothetical protein